jgi:hypothetical protein
MAKNIAKEKFILNEKYRKGTFVDKRQILKLMTDNINRLSIEARERTISTDNGESIVIEVHFNNAKICGDKVEQA